MVDYDKAINVGGGDGQGTMRIRDTGSIVEFWITSGDTYSFNYAWPWGYTVNGTTDNTRTFSYSRNAGWQKVGSWNVSTDQTVTFTVRANNAGNLSGPQSHSVNIQRAGPPSPPYNLRFFDLTNNAVRVEFTDGANNGSGIDARQIGYGTSSTYPQSYANEGTTITGLAAGTTYYFWGRTRNAKGWSVWSARSQATTHRVPDAPNPPTLSRNTQVSIDVVISARGNGGSGITGYQIGYSLSPDTPVTVISSDGSTTVTDLTPGKIYYFWARVSNVYGWSAWSPRSSAYTVVGAYAKVGNVWKQAIPYVRVAGVWKIARPMVRIGGVWKETY